MKELTIKEKAKRYDEAIDRANSLLSGNQIGNAWIYKLLPELKESEDEKIRKALIDRYQGDGCIGNNEYRIDYKDIRAWLEQQGKNNMGISEATKKKLEGNLNKALEKETPESCNEFLDEQKPADKVEPKFKIGDTIAKKHNSDIHDFGSFTITDITGGKYWYNDRIICDITEQDGWEIYEPVRQKPAWGEEDETVLTNTIIMLKEGASLHFNKKDITKALDWLKSLKERVQPQLKQEWSDEDGVYLNIIIEDLKELYKKRKADPVSVLGKNQRDNIDWLKSLRPQKQWKPSDEQIRILELAIDYWKPNDVSVTTPLYNLLEQLKKLREE